MKLSEKIILGCFISALALSGCGGGGGGASAPQKQTTKLYIYGNLSSNFNISNITTTLDVPSFSDYSAPTKPASGTALPVSSKVFLPTGKANPLSAATFATYNSTTNKLTITVTMDPFKNMSCNTTRNAGKGVEFATLITAPGTSLPTVDPSPVVGKFRLVPPNSTYQNGCKVNLAP